MVKYILFLIPPINYCVFIFLLQNSDILKLFFHPEDGGCTFARSFGTQAVLNYRTTEQSTHNNNNNNNNNSNNNSVVLVRERKNYIFQLLTYY
jgi:hypothetical protein